jgi:peptidoglycan/xylan/chitin deacetylase (PgdA/CDA1 family)
MRRSAPRAPVYVRVLCYHLVSEDRARPLDPWGVAPRTLERQLGLARRLGYRSLTLAEAVEAFETGKLSRRMLVVTFDDGYRDSLAVAAPILASLGFRATVFVVTDLVGKPAEWIAGAGEEAFLADWEQLRGLQDEGWEIGLHTATHPDLTALSADALRRETYGAKRSLEEAAGVQARTMAYPFGKYSPAVVDAVEEAGLRAAVTISRRSKVSPRSPRYALPRGEIRRDDGVAGFLSLLILGRPVT